MPTAYPVWDKVFQKLSACIYAEQVFCSLTTEMKYLPFFQGNTSLTKIHRESYETSYHQNTAAGNLQRLMMGTKTREQEKVLVLLTVECLIEARIHQKKAEEYLGSITADAAHQPWLDASNHWQHIRRHWLKSAARTFRFAIPQDWWTEGESLVE